MSTEIVALVNEVVREIKKLIYNILSKSISI